MRQVQVNTAEAYAQPFNALAQMRQARQQPQNAFAAMRDNGGPTVAAANALAPSAGQAAPPVTNADFIRYANQGAVRNQKLSPRLMNALGFLPDMGVTMEVFSGGQPEIGTSNARVGSTRHDNGHAADVFFHQSGAMLDWRNPKHIPILQEIVRRSKSAGLTGFGAGPGYMRPGSMHIGYGTPAVWGDEGKGANAPQWLRQAYYGS